MSEQDGHGRQFNSHTEQLLLPQVNVNAEGLPVNVSLWPSFNVNVHTSSVSLKADLCTYKVGLYIQL